ncbi:MAG: TerB family tellurite resistance protein [Alphaproteobacteria bacterium]|nr:TerB family tellurite resistance protein [Alphaproteobacteria bacterium]
MLNRIKQFFVDKGGAGSKPDGRHDEAELHVAAAAMLIEAAMMDGELDPRERQRIAVLIERHFGIGREEVDQIVGQGEDRQDAAVDIHSFLRIVNAHFDYDERVQLIEMLWDVAYADGDLHDHEANLVRRVAGMLGVEDRDAGLARKRVLARLEAGGANGDALHPLG